MMWQTATFRETYIGLTLPDDRRCWVRVSDITAVIQADYTAKQSEGRSVVVCGALPARVEYTVKEAPEAVMSAISEKSAKHKTG